MSAKYFDPFNEEKLEYGYECLYKSRWSFLIDHKGRLTTRKFRAQRKLIDKLPYCMRHTLFHPDDLKKLRQKPFSGLFFNFDKQKEEANRIYGEGDYFEALEYYEQIMGVFRWVEFTDPARNEDFFKALNLEPILDEHVVVKEKDLGDDQCEIEMRTNLVVTLLMSQAYCLLKLHHYTEAIRCLDYAIELAPIAADAYFRRSQARTYNRLATIAELRMAVDDANKALERRPKDKIYHKHKEHLE
jgi:tetratricopeptide (TPR) repeat protein